MLNLSTLQGVFYRATLPLPPGINASYKIVSINMGKKRINRLGATPELEQFKQLAFYELSNQTIRDLSIIQSIRESKKKIPLAVTIDFYFETLWKKDVDGGIKAVLDAVFDFFDLNDNLIVDLHVRKHVCKELPRCEIGLSCWEA